MLHGMMTAYQKTILLRRSGSFRWLMMRIRWQWQQAVSRLPTGDENRRYLSLYCYVRVQLTVLATDTPAQIATALVAAITRKIELPVTAAVKADATDTLTLTAKNAGLLGKWY
ncbi:hypothetical protein [Klebsiella pneumoniae]|uniref:hypothetical protein n=1 Tax=Klebsiella pneumoniae TaxID=573 RepID=UPI00355913CA